MQVYARYANPISIFDYEEVAIPAPVQPLVQLDAFSQPDDVYWDKPRAAGTYQVFNALVDRENRIGEWSHPAEFTSPSGWTLHGAAVNLKPSYDSIGVAWKIRCISLFDPDPNVMLQPGEESILCVSKFGMGPVSIGAKYPWGRLTFDYNLLAIGKSYYPLSKLKYGGSNTHKAQMPLIIASSLPNKKCEVAYAWFNAHGELSSLSPAVSIPATYGGSGSVERRFILRGQPVPPGAHGYQLFFRMEGDSEFRPSIHECKIDNLMPRSSGWIKDQGISGESKLKAILDPLQVAINKTSGDVVIGDLTFVEFRNPIIDIYDTAKFGRTIGRANGGQWYMLPSTYNIPTAIMIQNQRSRWVGMHLDCKRHHVTVGVCFSDYDGNQAFGNELVNCIIDMDQTGDHGTAIALRVSELCAGGGHSASEIICNKVNFKGTNPISLSHKQTANWLFRDCGAGAFIRAEHMDATNAVVHIDTPNLVRFEGLFHCDCPSGTIFSVEHGSVECDQLFVDKGCVSLIDFPHYESGYVSIKSGNVNFNQYDTIAGFGAPSNLVRAPATRLCQTDIGKLKVGHNPVAVTVNGGMKLALPDSAVIEARDILQFSA